jgi:hypothetical protein
MDKFPNGREHLTVLRCCGKRCVRVQINPVMGFTELWRT